MFAVAVTACLLVAQPEAVPGPDDPKAPPIDEVSIHTPNGWMLRVFPDGSGEVGYGSLLSDFAYFKAGTISFPAAVEQLRKVTVKEATRGNQFAVGLHEKGTTSTVSVYTKDEKIVLGLFETGAQKEASRVRGGRFDELWKERPPSLKKE